jgi:hypothetical protein
MIFRKKIIPDPQPLLQMGVGGGGGGGRGVPVYEVEVGYPVVGYQQAKAHVEQGRVHQVHLPHTESTKN